MRTLHSAELDRVHRALLPAGITPYGPEDLRHLVLALCGEAGELADLVKKDWMGKPPAELQKLLAEELTDVAIYVELIRRALSINLDLSILSKLHVLYTRWPETKP